MDWAAVVFAYAGMIILIFKKHWLNFVMFCISDALWILYYWPNRYWSLIILMFTYIAFQGYGAVRWIKINGGEQ